MRSYRDAVALRIIADHFGESVKVSSVSSLLSALFSLMA